MSAFFLTIEAEKETPTVNNSIKRTYFENLSNSITKKNMRWR